MIVICRSYCEPQTFTVFKLVLILSLLCVYADESYVLGRLKMFSEMQIELNLNFETFTAKCFETKRGDVGKYHPRAPIY